jgi:hypothetical protein
VGAGHFVRTFKNLKTVVTKSVRRLTNSPEYARSLVSLRRAIQAGLFRDGSGLEGAPAAAVASGCLSLLADATRRGGSADPDDYFAMIDPISGHPKRLVLARIDGVLARVERDLTSRRGGRRHRRANPGGSALLHLRVVGPPVTVDSLAPGAVRSRLPRVLFERHPRERAPSRAQREFGHHLEHQ